MFPIMLFWRILLLSGGSPAPPRGDKAVRRPAEGRCRRRGEARADDPRPSRDSHLTPSRIPAGRSHAPVGRNTDDSRTSARAATAPPRRALTVVCEHTHNASGLVAMAHVRVGALICAHVARRARASVPALWPRTAPGLVRPDTSSNAATAGRPEFSIQPWLDHSAARPRGVRSRNLAT